jgi:hypothetical protein
MTSHAGMMVLFAACISVVFATLNRDDVNAQLRLAARLFGGLVAGAYLTGWLLLGLFR